MKKCLIIGVLLFSSFWGKCAVSPVTLMESTLKINAKSEEVFYYGFAAGDELILSFETKNGVSLKELEITEMPSALRYLDYKVRKIESKSLSVMQTGIYKFRLKNTAIVGCVCKLKIQRQPAENASRNFNSMVYWHTVQDTVFQPAQETSILKRDTVAQTLMERTVKLAPSNPLSGNSNKDCLDFTLPKGTVSWSYYIGVGTEAQKAFAKVKTGFLNSAASVASRIPGYGSMAALALYGINAFNLIIGEDNVKYWFFDNMANAELFKKGTVWQGFRQGNVLSDAAQMRKPTSGRVYVGLLNDNLVEPINVMMSVTAIVVTEHAAANNKAMKITFRDEPYLKK